MPIRAAEPPPASDILQELRSFKQMGSVLYIAAHPDDENNQLIGYLARGRGYRTAYLSLTRGDGGQNVLGPEFGEALGVIRTQELLAARGVDGGRQFFSRAIDFGFSKDYKETLNFWDRQGVVSDIVRIIRTFQPDVIVTRFSPQPGGTHGHHTASAVLAIEAFKQAGDPRAFPEQLGALKPWQPKRILQNGRGGGDGDSLSLEIDDKEAPPGDSFGGIASRSRSMHKSQGFGGFGGGGGNRGTRAESFRLLGGEPASKDIFEGIDTTWNHVPGGAEIATMTDEVITNFDSGKSTASVPSLLKILGKLKTLPNDPVIEDKRQQLTRIIQTCLGLTVETTVADAEAVPGETLRLHSSAKIKADFPVTWTSMGSEDSKPLELHKGETATRDVAHVLPPNTPLSQPYWLRTNHTIGMARVEDPRLIGLPENLPVFPITQMFKVGDQTLAIADEPVQLITSPSKPEIRRRLEVIPPVSLRLLSEVRLFAPGATRPVTVEITTARADAKGKLELEAPAGWTVKPAHQSFQLAKVGSKAQFTFNVTAPQQTGTAEINARATINGKTSGNQRVEIHYDHIPPLLLQSPARFKAVCLDMSVHGQHVGYIPGAGDSVAEALEEMGYNVTRLTGADLTPEKLKTFDTVVVGIRAFNTRTDLAPQMTNLFAYVQAGGTVIEQYNRPDSLKVNQLAPYSLQLSQERVTDENAAVTFLAPDHPALNTPNKITSADFEGWVQERGTYFPNRWDDHFIPILACNDPGESPLKGSLLVAQYGKGYFVYTGLVWFRQLPEGVPGAYRLFANLVSLGK